MCLVITHDEIPKLEDAAGIQIKWNWIPFEGEVPLSCTDYDERGTRIARSFVPMTLPTNSAIIIDKNIQVRLQCDKLTSRRGCKIII